MSRPSDPRKNERRKPSTFGEETGLDVANDARRPVADVRFSPPHDIHGITRYMRQRQATGLCVVCGQPAPMQGATCKSPGCVRAWVFGGR
jgi:hypothetical protein